MAKYSVSFTIPEKKVPFFETAFEEKAEAFLWNLIEKGPQKGLWRAEAYFEEKPQDVKEDVRHGRPHRPDWRGYGHGFRGHHSEHARGVELQASREAHQGEGGAGQEAQRREGPRGRALDRDDDAQQA